MALFTFSRLISFRWFGNTQKCTHSDKHLLVVRCLTTGLRSPLNESRVDRLCADTSFYICPQTWLNEARTNRYVPPTMAFLNEKDSLAYSAMLGELSSGLSFTIGFFKTFKFSLIISWRGRTYLTAPLSFSWLKKTKYQKSNFVDFLTKFERQTLQQLLSRGVGQGSY